MTYAKEDKGNERHLLAEEVVQLVLQGKQFAVSPVSAHKDGQLTATPVLQLTVMGPAPAPRPAIA